MPKNIPSMIEITVRCDSPWRGVMITALQEFAYKWGWQLSTLEHNGATVMIGTARQRP